MDIQKLAKTLLSSDAISGLSKRSGASKTEVKDVLVQVLPTLLSGADDQAKSADTAESFTKALASHAKADTGNLASFLGGVDMEDGAKIIGHLLGAGTGKTTKSVAKKTGVSDDKIGAIMAAAAPLLMSLLGQQADEEEEKQSGVGGLMGALLENVDVGELLIGLLTDDSESESKAKSKSKSTSKSKSKTKSKSSSKSKSKSKKKEEENALGDIIGGILGKLLK